MTGALRVWWALRRGVGRESHIPAVLALVAFAVATAALLVCAGGLLGFRSRADVAGTDSAEYYVTLAWVACAVMVVPVLTLGGLAARLAASRRDQRLATLRLSGATSGQVVVMRSVRRCSAASSGWSCMRRCCRVWPGWSSRGARSRWGSCGWGFRWCFRCWRRSHCWPSCPGSWG